MLRTYLVCREKQANGTWQKHTVYWQQRSCYLNVWVVTEVKQCHWARSPNLGSPTCFWPLRNRESTGQNLKNDALLWPSAVSQLTALMVRKYRRQAGTLHRDRWHKRIDCLTLSPCWQACLVCFIQQISARNCSLLQPQLRGRAYSEGFRKRVRKCGTVGLKTLGTNRWCLDLPCTK
jgi:hypothetical protein